ncbi:MAG: demethylmenaquinone methyltransferase [Actinomycetota bacterium]|nr:demethylmenaquinone methyltransferase [Actinomycetota bacterium]
MPRAGLDKNPRDVAAMFDGVARHYDRTNSVLSFGQDRRWRRLTREAVGTRPGQRVLDLAAGTAASTVELTASGSWCVAADFSLDMLRGGRHRKVPLVGADALALPFTEACFDAVTISFGLRNIADTGAALVELARVTRPGGRLVVCEFSTPTWRPLRTVYLKYLMRALPVLARWVSSNPDAYVYLAESIRAWPDQPALAGQIAAAGWSEVTWHDLTGGIVAVHLARKPAPSEQSNLSGVPAGATERPRAVC